MKNFEVLIKNKNILKRASEIAKKIDEKYKNESIVLLCVLKGAVVFFSELIKRIKNKNIEIDFIRVKSYSGTSTSGSVKLIQDTDINLDGKNVVIVEDVVDTGYTANFLYQLLKERNPKNILMCALLQKPSKLQVKLQIELLIGFKIEDKFIIGYGLDLDEKYRTLKDILILKNN